MYPLGHIVSEISSTVILGSALLLALAAPRARAQPRPVAAARSLAFSATLSLAAASMLPDFFFGGVSKAFPFSLYMLWLTGFAMRSDPITTNRGSAFKNSATVSKVVRQKEVKKRVRKEG